MKAHWTKLHELEIDTPFQEWLSGQDCRKDVVGTLARIVAADESGSWPTERSAEPSSELYAWRAYLKRIHLRNADRILEVLGQAWMEYALEAADEATRQGDVRG